MKKIRKSMTIIAALAIGIIIGFSISVKATNMIKSSEVSYSHNNKEMNVEESLNELYKNFKETSDEYKVITKSGEQTLDKYYKKIKVNVTTNDWQYLEKPCDGKPIVVNVGYEPEIVYGLYNNNPFILINSINKVYHINSENNNLDDWTQFFSFNSNGFIVERYNVVKPNFCFWIKKPN